MTLQAQVRRLAKGALQQAGLSVLRTEQRHRLERNAEIGSRLAMLEMIDDEHLREALNLLGDSPSQLGQDFFVLQSLGWKRNGFFVEFGATDGKTHSNTWLLDTKFGWNGILAEPARGWQDGLKSAGRNAVLEFDCVWSRTGERLTFAETDWKELSTISEYAESDHHDRSGRRSYQVSTISLTDMLARHQAPAVMDYLSIDTEGSEWEILRHHDWDRYRFRCITCEHGFRPERDKIHALLTECGYERRFQNLSQFDDWYVLSAA
jgi:FkbM family methyltransferase